MPNNALTPNIVNLVGGAESYGLLGNFNTTSGQYDPLLASQVFSTEFLSTLAPANSMAALLRVDLGPIGYAQDYTGYDMLLMVNLSNGALTNPRLGVDGVFKPLVSGGWENDPLYGGNGDVP